MKFVIDFLKPTKGKIFIFLGIALLGGISWGVFSLNCAFTYSGVCEILEPITLVFIGGGEVI